MALGPTNMRTLSGPALLVPMAAPSTDAWSTCAGSGCCAFFGMSIVLCSVTSDAVFRLVGKENRGEIEVAYAGPVKGAV